MSGIAIAYPHLDNQQYNHYDIDTASLSTLYPEASDYLWIKQQHLSANAYDALNFISHSINHGLNPNDYHQELLQHLDPENDGVDAHLFDFMLTDGLLKLIRDISTGKLDPAIVDPKWSIPRATFNATEFLQQSLSDDNLEESLASLIPNSIQYQYLTAAAERYQNYVYAGGWPNILETTKLRAGDTHYNIATIRNRLLFENYTLQKNNLGLPNYYDNELKLAVQKFQIRHSLYADGIIGPATYRAMNVSADKRLQQININLERLRWLPDNLGDRYIMVNLANYRLTAIENDTIKLDMRVIVGKNKRSTPSFISKMTHVIQNPRWYIPNKLARLDLLPKQQNNPDYFDRYNIRVFNTTNGKKTELDPHSIDWNSISKQNFPYSLVQDPGKKNALGKLKFILPNPWRIYLHDTPSKNLFNKSKRTFSSGCIRVEDPFALADFSLSGNNAQHSLVDISDTTETLSTKLEQPLSVYAIYTTVRVNGKELIFLPDNYKRDQKMAKYL